jgi:hypothetical protein
VTEFTLHRYEDVSNVSGPGDVAWGVEWPDGSVAIRWHGEHPSTATWNDIRDVEAIHGHAGKTVVRYVAMESRLLEAWRIVAPFLCNEYTRPVTVGAHPDHFDRLRLCFTDEPDWRYWVALLDGNTYAATHTVQAGEICHRWIDPSGSLWLEYFTPAPAEDPLETFDREDRG